MSELEQLLTPCAVNPEELLNLCFQQSFLSEDWGKVLEYAQDASAFLEKTFREDWESSVKHKYPQLNDEIRRLVAIHPFHY